MLPQVGHNEKLPPYVGYVNCGQPIEVSYTEEAVGSSPIPPTFSPPGMGFFSKHYLWGVFQITTLFDEFLVPFRCH